MRSILKQLGITLIAAFATSGDIFAQEVNRSGAVEEFSPALDVVSEMRPRAGLYGITELMIAALKGDLAEIDRLLEQGTNIDETDMSGGTPLMWAVHGGDMRAVDLLLERGANINAVGARNSSALTTAIFGDKEDIGVRLLNAGAKFGGELIYQRDYLQYAAEKGQARMISALIEQGVEIESSGPDALCLAIRNEKFESALKT